MNVPLAVLMWLSMLISRPAGRAVTLDLPHALRDGETATLVITVGVIPRGAEVVITTASGQLLGAISPYGIRAGNEAGTYSLPLPANAIRRKRVSLLVSIHGGDRSRAPTKKEVKRVRVKLH